jgi:monovalent cation:H+ antiporter-2, CPA2 family
LVDLTLAFDLVIVLAAAFVGGAVAVVFRQPPVTGYLLGGLLFGPQALGVIHQTNDIKTLAEVGVAFLMFTLGLEFSLDRVKAYSKVVVVGVLVQMFVSTLSALLFEVIFGWNTTQSLFFGLMLGFSSTAVVVKALLNRGELETTHGKLASAWLIVQDLSVLPTLIILSSIGGGANVEVGIGLGILKTIVFLIATIYLGTKLAPRVLGQIAASGSREIFLLAAMILVLGVAFLTSQFGLSFALGGFLAGLIISESQFSQQVFADVKNVRDLFATLFFVSIGMLVGPLFILQNLVPILIVLTLMGLVKLMVATTWIYKFGYHLRTSLLAAASLLQIGEFSFVVANLGLEKSFINLYQYQLILAAALFSLIVTPFWIDETSPVYHWAREMIMRRFPRLQHFFFTGKVGDVGDVGIKLSDHIVLVGYGRAGRFLSHAMNFAGVPHLVIDLDHRKLREPESKNIPTIYGDAVEEEILNLANIKKAKAVVITHGEIVSTELTIQKVRSICPGIRILARAHSDKDVADLRALGIYRVVQPEFESSLTMTHKVLDFMGIPKDETEGLIKKLRREHHG